MYRFDGENVETLTKKQRTVLDYISKRLSAGDNPSQRQVASHLGVSQNAVFQFIRHLKNKGYLKSEKGHRNLKISAGYMHKENAPEKIPVMGCALTGTESKYDSSVKRVINPSNIFNKTAGIFFVRASGSGAASAGILDGDYVLVKPGNDISDGQITIVLVDDKIWLKKVRIKKGKIFLVSASDGSKRGELRQKIELTHTKIIGRVIGCIRLPAE